MKPTAKDLEMAVAAMSAMKFFPPAPATIAFVMDMLARMVDEKQKLAWLTETLVDNVSEWPGAAQVRALFCTRFAPADGIDGPPCELGGFTAADGERKYLEREAARGYIAAGDSPRRLTGEVEPVSASSDLQVLVEGIAKQKSMSGTPMTRMNERRRIEELLK